MVKVIQRVLKPVYEVLDLLSRLIEVQFYNYDLVKVTVTPDTEFEIDKIVRSRKNEAIILHLANWRGYDETFNSWENASYMKKI